MRTMRDAKFTNATEDSEENENANEKYLEKS
jgi:hypothetical protein